jgi:hypothetical protein
MSARIQYTRTRKPLADGQEYCESLDGSIMGLGAACKHVHITRLGPAVWRRRRQSLAYQTPIFLISPEFRTMPSESGISCRPKISPFLPNTYTPRGDWQVHKCCRQIYFSSNGDLSRKVRTVRCPGPR